MRVIDRLLKKARELRGADYETQWERWSGRFYDDLTDREKDEYCKYFGTTRSGYEGVMEMIGKGLHYELDKRPTPPRTPEEHQAILDEIEAAFFEAKEQDKEGVPEL